MLASLRQIAQRLQHKQAGVHLQKVTIIWCWDFALLHIGQIHVNMRCDNIMCLTLEGVSDI